MQRDAARSQISDAEQRGDDFARGRVVDEDLPHVGSVVGHVRGGRAGREHLLQDGALALLNGETGASSVGGDEGIHGAGAEAGEEEGQGERARVRGKGRGAWLADDVQLPWRRRDHKQMGRDVLVQQGSTKANSVRASLVAQCQLEDIAYCIWYDTRSLQ